MHLDVNYGTFNWNAADEKDKMRMQCDRDERSDAFVYVRSKPRLQIEHPKVHTMSVLTLSVGIS